MGGESTIAERWLRFTGIVGDTLATDYVLAPSTATTMISMLVYVYRHVIPHWTSLDIDMYSGHNESPCHSFFRIETSSSHNPSSPLRRHLSPWARAALSRIACLSSVGAPRAAGLSRAAALRRARHPSPPPRSRYRRRAKRRGRRGCAAARPGSAPHSRLQSQSLGTRAKALRLTALPSSQPPLLACPPPPLPQPTPTHAGCYRRCPHRRQQTRPQRLGLPPPLLLPCA